jgi:hypothetical protein
MVLDALRSIAKRSNIFSGTNLRFRHTRFRAGPSHPCHSKLGERYIGLSSLRLRQARAPTLWTAAPAQGLSSRCKEAEVPRCCRQA